MRPRFTWKLRSRDIALGERTVVMGVLNVTPDSFSDGGKFAVPEKAIERGLRMLDEGADILDVGGESTRPGAMLEAMKSGEPLVSETEELQRVLPVIEGIRRARPEAVISIDTYKSGTGRQAVDAGAEIVNDVSGFLWDRKMAPTCGELRCGVVLMHTRGKPDQWQHLPQLSDIASAVQHDLANRVQTAFEGDVERARIVLDPGFGFGKVLDDNYPLLANLELLQRLGFPLLVGTSRKSFVGRTVGKRVGHDVPPSERLFGSLAAMVASILHGAHIVRVHDVRPAVEAAAVADEVVKSRGQGSGAAPEK
jgi:dihydropteroate synthase